ncbi:hypothetical protein V8C86DRAFT_2874713 [Haematococcus lacustris]
MEEQLGDTGNCWARAVALAGWLVCLGRARTAQEAVPASETVGCNQLRLAMAYLAARVNFRFAVTGPNVPSSTALAWECTQLHVKLHFGAKSKLAPSHDS